jgi:hypothetical protein
LNWTAADAIDFKFASAATINESRGALKGSRKHYFWFADIIDLCIKNAII